MNNLDLLNPPEWYIITCPNCSCIVLVENDPNPEYIYGDKYSCYCNKCSISFTMGKYIYLIEINNIEFRAVSNLSYSSFINGDNITISVSYSLNDKLIEISYIDNPNINSYEQINKIFLDYVKRYLDNIIFE